MNTPLNGLENGSKKEKNKGSSRTPKISVDAPGPAGSIGARARKLRLALGYTRQAFSDAIGTPTSALIAWETGAAEPSRGALESLCRTFAVDREWLETGAGRPFPDFMDAAQSFTLCPKIPFLRDESVPFDAKTREKTRRFVAALTPRQRRRALLFYADLVATLKLANGGNPAAEDTRLEGKA